MLFENDIKIMVEPLKYDLNTSLRDLTRALRDYDVNKNKSYVGLVQHIIDIQKDLDFLQQKMQLAKIYHDEQKRGKI